MALTATFLNQGGKAISHKEVTLSLAFDSSYPTGGEALDLSSYFSHGVEAIVSVNSVTEASNGYEFFIDGTATSDGRGVTPSTVKVVVNQVATDVQVADTTNLSTLDDIVVTFKGW